jgi:hypothetical protein
MKGREKKPHRKISAVVSRRLFFISVMQTGVREAVVHEDKVPDWSISPNCSKW